MKSKINKPIANKAGKLREYLSEDYWRLKQLHTSLVPEVFTPLPGGGCPVPVGPLQCGPMASQWQPKLTQAISRLRPD